MEEVIEIINLYLFILGSADYYHIPGTMNTKLDRLNPYEKKIEIMSQTTPGGRGTA